MLIRAAVKSDARLRPDTQSMNRREAHESSNPQGATAALGGTNRERKERLDGPVSCFGVDVRVGCICAQQLDFPGSAGSPGNVQRTHRRDFLLFRIRRSGETEALPGLASGQYFAGKRWERRKNRRLAGTE